MISHQTKTYLDELIHFNVSKRMIEVIESNEFRKILKKIENTVI